MSDFLEDFRRIALGRELPSLVEGEENEVYVTIVKQLAGSFNKLRMMLGAKDITPMPKGVSIKWPNKTRSKGNVVVITLTPADEYDMEFFNNDKPVKKYEGLHADQLKSTFEMQTGWYLSL